MALVATDTLASFSLIVATAIAALAGLYFAVAGSLLSSVISFSLEMRREALRTATTVAPLVRQLPPSLLNSQLGLACPDNKLTFADALKEIVRSIVTERFDPAAYGDWGPRLDKRIGDLSEPMNALLDAEVTASNLDNMVRLEFNGAFHQFGLAFKSQADTAELWAEASSLLKWIPGIAVFVALSLATNLATGLSDWGVGEHRTANAVLAVLLLLAAFVFLAKLAVTAFRLWSLTSDAKAGTLTME